MRLKGIYSMKIVSTENRKIGTIYNQNGFKISLSQGKKGDTEEQKRNDRVIVIQTLNPHKITMQEMAIISRELSISEDNLYPRTLGKMGRNKVLQLIKYAIQKWHWSISDCCYQCELPGYEDENGLPKNKKQRMLFE